MFCLPKNQYKGEIAIHFQKRWTPVHLLEGLTGYVRGLWEVSSIEHIVPHLLCHLLWPMTCVC